MKNLNLENYGVQEMNAEEMSVNNGGTLIIADWEMIYRIFGRWSWGHGDGPYTA
ncbi:MAG: hypothetical protein PHH37_02415 [Paludibacter sp.]|nr:hypothetical protein [Paludibacter sp.]